MEFVFLHNSDIIPRILDLSAKQAGRRYTYACFYRLITVSEQQESTSPRIRFFPGEAREDQWNCGCGYTHFQDESYECE